MPSKTEAETCKRFIEKPGISLAPGPGELNSVLLEHEGASVLVCTHGAHVLDYRPRGHASVLWLSSAAAFARAKPIRGGIPICWPWFAEQGIDATLPAHGFARTAEWALIESVSSADEKAVVLALQDDANTRLLWPHTFELRYRISLAGAFCASLSVFNTGAQNMQFTAALHSYFDVRDVSQSSLEGLQGRSYLDKVDGFRRGLQSEKLLRFATETDRIYIDTEDDCVIHDGGRARAIRIRKTGSRTTVVWNPWQVRAGQLADFPDDGYRGMLCVEAANAAADVIELAPGASHTLAIAIETVAERSSQPGD